VVDKIRPTGLLLIYRVNPLRQPGTRAELMSSRTTTRTDTRTLLIEVGTLLMMEKGYSNTGIQEILTATGVPKGSFYHYFDSKESFAVAIIRHFDQHYAAGLLSTLANLELTPLQRLKAYCEQGKALLAAQECRKGCLIGNLSQEMSDQSEGLRLELSAVMRKWCDLFAACIEEGQKRAEIKAHRPAGELAELFAAGWSGAVMRAKTVKNTQPLDTFILVFFEDVLKA
jgi:TetR/AcrR family transcriptional repressor of nem operon